MADDENAPAEEVAPEEADGKSKQKKKRKTSALSSTPKPKIKDMVEEAISLTQDGRNGSSLQAIKKFLSANYGLDKPTYVRNAIKRGVSSGDFVQLKGVGASGSFKLGSSSTPKPPLKTTRQKDSDKVRQAKETKSEQEAKRIAKNTKKAKKEREAKKAGGQAKKLKVSAKPAKVAKKVKSHKKVEKKKSPKKSPKKTKKGSKK